MTFYREISRFKARSENGDEHIVIESQVTVLHDFGFSPTSNSKSYMTTTEIELVSIDEDTFKFPLADTIIKRV